MFPIYSLPEVRPNNTLAISFSITLISLSKHQILFLSMGIEMCNPSTIKCYGNNAKCKHKIRSKLIRSGTVFSKVILGVGCLCEISVFRKDKKEECE